MHLLLLNDMKPESISVLENFEDVIVSVITSNKQENKRNISFYEVNNIFSYDNILSKALEINNIKEIDYILSSEELLIPYAGFLNSYFNLDNLDYSSSINLTNKISMKQKLNNKNIKTAKFKKLNSITNFLDVIDDSDFPVIIKPSIGAGSMNTYKIINKKHFNELINNKTMQFLMDTDIPIIIEEYIDMKNEYHCEAIILNGLVKFSSIGRYFEPSLLLKKKSVSGSVNVKHSECSEAIIQTLSKVIDALEIKSGVVHMEVFQTDNEIYVGEVGCRPAGGLITEIVKKQYNIDLWNNYMLTHLKNKTDLESINEEEKFWGWLGLTCKEGKITQITDTEVLKKVKNVEEVIDIYNVGDIVDPKWKDSTIFFSKLIIFSLNNLDELDELRKELTEVYYIETDF